METVALIKDILAGNRIEVRESRNEADAAGVYSCRITLAGGLEEGDFGTNGKGMTEEYSLASGYAELMERLQNLILFGDYPEGLYHSGKIKYFTAPDEVMLDAEASYKNAGKVLGKLMRLPEDFKVPEGGTLSPSVPYKNIFTDEEVLLPHKTLRMVIGSNGMAAGNNYKEAVIQGLCEIYERAAVREAYEFNRPIPRLHPESFSGNEIYARLEKLQEAGYKYSILDLSMGKSYPVIGLLLEKGGRKAFKAGADPCPVTALERCLTELFQGKRAETERLFHAECCAPFPEAGRSYKRWDINDAEIAFNVDGTGLIAECLFDPSREYSEDYKCTEGESEEADYDYMLALTKGLGYDLFVRDWSFLGFPSYQIIVPELSNYDLIYEDGAEIYEWSFDEIRFREDVFTDGIAKILNSFFGDR